MCIFITHYSKFNKRNSHIDVSAKVLKEFDLALGEEEARFQGHLTVQGSVETSQDLCLVLCHVPTVLQLKQVKIQFWTCL